MSRYWQMIRQHRKPERQQYFIKVEFEKMASYSPWADSTKTRLSTSSSMSAWRKLVPTYLTRSIGPPHRNCLAPWSQTKVLRLFLLTYVDAPLSLSLLYKRDFRGLLFLHARFSIEVHKVPRRQVFWVGLISRIPATTKIWEVLSTSVHVCWSCEADISNASSPKVPGKIPACDQKSNLLVQLNRQPRAINRRWIPQRQ